MISPSLTLTLSLSLWLSLSLSLWLSLSLSLALSLSRARTLCRLFFSHIAMVLSSGGSKSLDCEYWSYAACSPPSRRAVPKPPCLWLEGAGSPTHPPLLLNLTRLTLADDGSPWQFESQNERATSRAVTKSRALAAECIQSSPPEGADSGGVAVSECWRSRPATRENQPDGCCESSGSNVYQSSASGPASDKEAHFESRIIVATLTAYLCGVNGWLTNSLQQWSHSPLWGRSYFFFFFFRYACPTVQVTPIKTTLGFMVRCYSLCLLV